MIRLNPLAGQADLTMLAWRLLVGAFLIWGVWDNIVSAADMAKFAGFLGAHGFPYPKLMAPLSVWAQFACGVAFILGLMTRWAGWMCAINFAVAIAMVDAKGGIRQAFPAAMLVAFGLYLAAAGAGRYAVDRFLKL